MAGLIFIGWTAVHVLIKHTSSYDKYHRLSPGGEVSVNVFRRLLLLLLLLYV